MGNDLIDDHPVIRINLEDDDYQLDYIQCNFLSSEKLKIIITKWTHCSLNLQYVVYFLWCCVILFLCHSLFIIVLHRTLSSSATIIIILWFDNNKRLLFFLFFSMTFQSMILSLATPPISIILLSLPFRCRNRNILGYWVKYYVCGCPSSLPRHAIGNNNIE